MYQLLQDRHKNVTLAIISIAAGLTVNFAIANNLQASTVQTVTRESAVSNSTNVPVWAGRSTFIDFSGTNEVITYILLADPSRTVYSTDTPLASKQTKTIFLKPIKPLQFRGATTSHITNLSVKTQSPDGKQRLYTFNIIPKSGRVTTNGIVIIPFIVRYEPRILLAGNKTATTNDIERGLAIAISRKYTKASDPVVLKVREFIALVTNSVPVNVAAQRANIAMNVITALAQFGLEQTLPRLAEPQRNTSSYQPSARTRTR